MTLGSIYFYLYMFSFAFVGDLFFFFSKKISVFCKKNIFYNYGQILLVKLAFVAESFFYPTLSTTKNYIYSRLLYVTLKTYLKLEFKAKLLIFFKCSLQIVKIQLQEVFQEEIKGNFGGHYPFISRLLNFYPYFFFAFFLILCHNITGLLFYGFTNTAFLLQNFTLSFQTVVGLTIYGFLIRSFLFYKMFVPSNVPIVLLPFLVIIEIISHLAKIFSLAIRLFANMMSGHVLLHILMGFVVTLAKKTYLYIFFPTILIMSIVLLEFGISLLQAYVFLTLIAIYFEEHFSFTQNEENTLLSRAYVKGKKIIAQKTFLTLKKFFVLKKNFPSFFKWFYLFNPAKKGRLSSKVYWSPLLHEININS